MMLIRYRFLTIIITILLLLCSVLISCSDDNKSTRSENTNTVIDIDGNVYQTVTIGDQVWMAENLRVTHFRNGDPIPNEIDTTGIYVPTTEVYLNYDNSENTEIYGCLYNLRAVTHWNGLAPQGWHVATDDDWKQLEMYLGMNQSDVDSYGWRGSDMGGKLKETGTSHWQAPNLGATNESGFNAVPGGMFDWAGNFTKTNKSSYFWTSSTHEPNTAWGRRLSNDSSSIRRVTYHTVGGFSVRCVKD